jgi:hypothetical protein
MVNSDEPARIYRLGLLLHHSSDTCAAFGRSHPRVTTRPGIEAMPVDSLHRRLELLGLFWVFVRIIHGKLRYQEGTGEWERYLQLQRADLQQRCAHPTHANPGIKLTPLPHPRSEQRDPAGFHLWSSLSIPSILFVSPFSCGLFIVDQTR